MTGKLSTITVIDTMTGHKTTIKRKMKPWTFPHLFLVEYNSINYVVGTDKTLRL